MDRFGLHITELEEWKFASGYWRAIYHALREMEDIVMNKTKERDYKRHIVYRFFAMREEEIPGAEKRIFDILKYLDATEPRKKYNRVEFFSMLYQDGYYRWGYLNILAKHYGVSRERINQVQSAFRTEVGQPRYSRYIRGRPGDYQFIKEVIGELLPEGRQDNGQG